MNIIGTERAAPTSAPEHVMLSLLATAGALMARLESALADVDLSMPKLCLLSQIVEAGDPLALSDLATGLRCVRSNVTQLVDRLEADGLVRRVDDPSDRRIVRAEVTALGVERQAEGRRVLARIQEEFTARLTEEERASLER